MVEESVVEIDDVKNADWMHTLPGYKDEVNVIKAALAKLSKKVKKQLFHITLGSKSRS